MKNEDIGYLKIILFYLLMLVSLVGVHKSEEAFLGMNYFNFPWSIAISVTLLLVVVRIFSKLEVTEVSELWMEYPQFEDVKIWFFVAKATLSMALIFNVGTFVKFNFISAPATVLIFFSLSILLPELIYAGISNLKFRKGLK